MEQQLRPKMLATLEQTLKQMPTNEQLHEMTGGLKQGPNNEAVSEEDKAVTEALPKVLKPIYGENTVFCANLTDDRVFSVLGRNWNEIKNEDGVAIAYFHTLSDTKTRGPRYVFLSEKYHPLYFPQTELDRAHVANYFRLQYRVKHADNLETRLEAKEKLQQARRFCYDEKEDLGGNEVLEKWRRSNLATYKEQKMRTVMFLDNFYDFLADAERIVSIGSFLFGSSFLKAEFF